MTTNYQVCTNCVMDTSDSEIVFDVQGVCNHCQSFYERSSKEWRPTEEGKRELDVIVNKIKQKNKNKRYDCILGLSGGVDSSYLALILKEYGLRVLVVHVDAGWNQEMAVSNIQHVVSHCNFDLYTHVVDWEDIKRLQVAYLKSGISNQDVPQDHVFFAVLFKLAVKHDIKVFISGGNIATESILPDSWHGNAMDVINLKAIFKQFGSGKLKNYDTISFLDYHILFRLRGMRQYRPLNYLPYDRNGAIRKLEAIGWRNYGRKHGESFFTKFFQNYFLPVRFGYDKRKAHYSSMIVSKQMTRAEAIDKLNEPLYDPMELENDIVYFCKKLDISRADLDTYLKMPLKKYIDYDNWDSKLKYVSALRKAYDVLRKLR
jgi:N-acetyl sugar amidotransferase